MLDEKNSFCTACCKDRKDCICPPKYLEWWEYIFTVIIVSLVLGFIMLEW